MTEAGLAGSDGPTTTVGSGLISLELRERNDLRLRDGEGMRDALLTYC